MRAVEKLAPDEDSRTLGVYAKAFGAALFGLLLGFLTTWIVTGRDYPFGAAQAGPWRVWPKAGSLDIDPYALAVVARRAEAPLGSGEGLSFLATRDSKGDSLEGACVYEISGPLPPARFWTLTVFSTEGRLLPTTAGRYGLTSSEILREGAGAFKIAVAPTVSSGNWLSAGRHGPFALVFNLYDTTLSATVSALEDLPMPEIRRESCR